MFIDSLTDNTCGKTSKYDQMFKVALQSTTTDRGTQQVRIKPNANYCGNRTFKNIFVYVA